MKFSRFVDEYIEASLEEGGLPDGTVLLHEVDALGSPEPRAGEIPGPSAGSSHQTGYPSSSSPPPRFASASSGSFPPPRFSHLNREIPPATFSGDSGAVDAVLKDLEAFTQHST
jgi:hypothetical protein